jgi:hypothetical protein
MLLLQSNHSYDNALRLCLNGDNSNSAYTPSKQALSQARYKINHSAPEAVNTSLLTDFYLSAEQQLESFCGLRTLAVDGTGIRLEDRAYNEMLKELREQNIDLPISVSEPLSPTIRGSILHDVYNEMVVDIKAVANVFSEQELAIAHCDQLQDFDLMLFDRGYHALWLWAVLGKMGRKFVCRARSNARYIKKFLKSNKQEDVIEVTIKKSNLNVSSRHKALIKKHAGDLKAGDTLKLRLIRYEQANENGELITYVMVSNLLDLEKYPCEEFKHLYERRWRIEEGIKTHKVSGEIERWTGVTWFSARQDIYLNILLYNLTRMTSMDTDKAIRARTVSKKGEGRLLKYCRKLNITAALRCMRTVMVKLVHSFTHLDYSFCVEQQVNDFCDTIAQYETLIRPGRSFSRKIKNSAKRFHMNCKSNT